jgi:hypothetical protein
MSRFIVLEDRMINVDHIVEVVDHDDGVVTICLTNGEMIPADSEVCDDILGYDHAVSVVPCGPNLWARMTYPNGKTFCIPVGNLILNADGTYYPLEAELLEDSSEGALRFEELFSNDGEEASIISTEENGPRFKVRHSSR